MENVKLLLVEDSEGDILLIKDIVSKSENVTLCVINDGQKALDYIETTTEPPNLILLDINLPKVNGLRLLRNIKGRKLFRKTKVVILTTSSNENEKRAAFEAEANDFITKSYDPFEFETSINDLLFNF